MLDMFKMALDGKRNSCLPLSFPIRNYRRDYYELKFNVPPQPDDPSTISWALIVKFIAHSDAQYNCFFPGLTFFVETDENPYVFMECPRDQVLVTPLLADVCFVAQDTQVKMKVPLVSLVCGSLHVLRCLLMGAGPCHPRYVKLKLNGRKNMFVRRRMMQSIKLWTIQHWM